MYTFNKKRLNPVEAMQAVVLDACEKPLPGGYASDKEIVGRVLQRVYATMPELNKCEGFFQLSPELAEAKNKLIPEVHKSLALIYPGRFQRDLAPEENPAAGLFSLNK